MKIELIKNEKNDVEFKIDNSTIVEVLRVYLYKEGVEFAAWRREHPSKPILMKVQTKEGSVKKAVSRAVESIKKDCDKILAGIKK